ncbi:MAG TPA: gamma-glutamyl-phosphate reductase, partial [Methylococcaceae bacterium]|nr:gamma-glutamyl-phosphate reductase [Methylococcaceae bacterium]
MTDLSATLHQLGENAVAAARLMSKAETAAKNSALQRIADGLLAEEPAIRSANARDLQAGKAAGLDAAMLDRLELTPARVQAMADGVRQVAALPDPVGEITGLTYRPSGIQVGKMRVPLGVI